MRRGHERSKRSLEDRSAVGRESEAYPASCVSPPLSRFRQLIASAGRGASCDGGMRSAFPPYAPHTKRRSPPITAGKAPSDDVRFRELLHSAGTTALGAEPTSGRTSYLVPPPPPCAAVQTRCHRKGRGLRPQDFPTEWVPRGHCPLAGPGQRPGLPSLTFA